jgi:hypothetical protein
MSTDPTTVFDPPIIGADGNQVIAVENSVSFKLGTSSGKFLRQ